MNSFQIVRKFISEEVDLGCIRAYQKDAKKDLNALFEYIQRADLFPLYDALGCCAERTRFQDALYGALQNLFTCQVLMTTDEVKKAEIFHHA